MMKKELMEKIENVKANSAWEKGVKNYAVDLVDGLEIDELPETWERIESTVIKWCRKLESI